MIHSFAGVLESLPRRWPVAERYLVGVSGGRDSTTLLRGLAEAGYRALTVCHLNHCLRGGESDADEAFVRGLAEELRCGFASARVDVAAVARAARISLETAGRRERSRFFLETARRLECPRIFLAHHADDQAETALMNLCRGAAGPRGMKEESRLRAPGAAGELRVLRPLLSVRRADLAAHAAARGWTFREDASNASGEFVRNRVRNELLPLMNDIFRRDVSPAILRAAALSGEAAAFLESEAERFSSAERLELAPLRALPEALQRAVLHQWLTRRHGVPDVSLAHVEALREMLRPAPGRPAKRNLPGNRFARRSRGFLWLEPTGPGK